MAGLGSPGCPTGAVEGPRPGAALPRHAVDAAALLEKLRAELDVAERERKERAVVESKRDTHEERAFKLQREVGWFALLSSSGKIAEMYCIYGVIYNFKKP